jgi:hypothetical protein
VSAQVLSAEEHGAVLDLWAVANALAPYRGEEAQRAASKCWRAIAGLEMGSHYEVWEVVLSTARNVLAGERL